LARLLKASKFKVILGVQFERRKADINSIFEVVAPFVPMYAYSVLTGNVDHFVGRHSIANEGISSLPLLVRVAWVIRVENDGATYIQTNQDTNICVTLCNT